MILNAIRVHFAELGAVANKAVRTAWALLTKGENYKTTPAI